MRVAGEIVPGRWKRRPKGSRGKHPGERSPRPGCSTSATRVGGKLSARGQDERETVALCGLARGGRAARDSIEQVSSPDDASTRCDRGREGRRHAGVPRGSVTLQKLSDASSSRSALTRRRRGEASGPGRWSERKRARVEDASGPTDVASGHAQRHRRPRLSGSTRRTPLRRPAGRRRWTLAFRRGRPRSDETSEVRWQRRSRRIKRSVDVGRLAEARPSA